MRRSPSATPLSPSPAFSPPVQTVKDVESEFVLYQGGFHGTIPDWTLVSPWHDIPLILEGSEDNETGVPLLNLVTEIPAGTSAKLEMDESSYGTPIKQDVKKGAPRWLKAPSPIEWNYGAFPRTWEDPNENDALVGLPGDGDPLDVLELGADLDGPLPVGAVTPVKVLGALALIDEGETDWKILTIRASLLEQRSSLDEVPSELLNKAIEWYRSYKTHEGKPMNEYALNGTVLSDTDTWAKVIVPASAAYSRMHHHSS